MNILEIWPIKILPQKLHQPFSYFSAKELPKGSIVEINIHNQKTLGIVVSSAPLSSRKSELRKKNFVLKKIDRVTYTETPFAPLIIAAQEISALFLEPAGSVLKTTLPLALPTVMPLASINDRALDIFRETHEEIIVGTIDERINYYETIIRESFAKKQNILLLVPTVTIAEYCGARLAHLPKKPAIIHGSLTKSQWKTLAYGAGSPLIIGTPLALGLAQGNEHIVIIEDSDSPHWNRSEHPRFAVQKLIKIFAREIRSKCIEGKSFLSLEDYNREVKPHYLSSRIKNKNHRVIFQDTPSQALSPALTEIVQEAEGKLLFFVSRKGFYSLITCLDCGTIATCTNCKGHLSLHASNKREFICHHCGSGYPSLVCSNCGSWNQKGYGTGTERVLTEMKRIHPKRDIWVYDDDHAKNRTSRESIKKAFRASRDGILIGTELLLEDPSIIADECFIVSIDNLFSIPDFTINQKILRTITLLAEKSRADTITIQTRFPSHPLFEYFLRQDMKGFMANELHERKNAHLPPYAILVKISFEEKNKVERDIKVQCITETLESLQLDFSSYPSFKNKNACNILITTIEEEWKKKAHGVLPLTTIADIVVNPESIL